MDLFTNDQMELAERSLIPLSVAMKKAIDRSADGSKRRAQVVRN